MHRPQGRLILPGNIHPNKTTLVPFSCLLEIPGSHQIYSFPMKFSRLKKHASAVLRHCRLLLIICDLKVLSFLSSVFLHNYLLRVSYLLRDALMSQLLTTDCSDTKPRGKLTSRLESFLFYVDMLNVSHAQRALQGQHEHLLCTIFREPQHV